MQLLNALKKSNFHFDNYIYVCYLRFGSLFVWHISNSKRSEFDATIEFTHQFGFNEELHCRVAAKLPFIYSLFLTFSSLWLRRSSMLLIITIFIWTLKSKSISLVGYRIPAHITTSHISSNSYAFNHFNPI